MALPNIVESAAAIASKIKLWQDQRARAALQVEQAAEGVKRAKAAFEGGDPYEAVDAAESVLGGRRKALSAIDERLSELEVQRVEAERADASRREYGALVAKAAEGVETTNALRIALDEVAVTFAEGIARAAVLWTAQAEGRNYLLAHGRPHFDALEAAGVDLSGLTLDLSGGPSFWLPHQHVGFAFPEPYGDLLRTAILRHLGALARPMVPAPLASDRSPSNPLVRPDASQDNPLRRALEDGR